jgi:hypothetical protein
MKSLVRAAMILCASTLHAQQPASDWRMIGETKDEAVFYDASGMRKLPNGHLEVWLKALPLKAIIKAYEQRDKERRDRAVRKLVSGYVPPVWLDKPPMWFEKKTNRDQITDAVVFEEVANEAAIEPSMRLLVEVDCPNRLTRNLSAWFNLDGKVESSEKPGEWEHIAPETNINRLHMDACR